MDDSDMISEPESSSDEESQIEEPLLIIEENEKNVKEVKNEIKKKKRLYYVMDYDIEDLRTEEEIKKYIELVKLTINKKDRYIKSLKRKYKDLSMKTKPTTTSDMHVTCSD